MKQLNPFEIPLKSINLIEASAGTGKSWTVTLLYLRLILESELSVDQILVVTFTDAATKELRDAVRTRLVEALDAFELWLDNSNPSLANNNQDKLENVNDEYKTLLAKYFDEGGKQNSLDSETAINRLKKAKLSIDEAAIFTIHGFCQRALTENAFEAGLPFESELMDDDKELMQKLTDDFWRRRFVKAPKALLFKLNQKSITPDTLLKDVRNAVGKPYLSLCGPQDNREESEENSKKWEYLEGLLRGGVKTWKDQSEEIRELLTNPEYEKAYYADLVNARQYIFSEIEKMSLSQSLPASIDLKKMSWLGTRLKIKKTAKIEDVSHSLFQQWQEFLDCWSRFDSNSDDFINQIRIDLLQHLQEELPKEKKRLGLLAFDDLLLQLQAALKQPAANSDSGLASDLRKKYKVAMIDEFQDTDPIQYDIFTSIYGLDDTSKTQENAVFFVGDPKQAIYSFRGGDIHTYIKAKHDTPLENHYTLNTNYRSHPDLIMAYNTLYAYSDNPFKDADIKYEEVGAGKKDLSDLQTHDQRKPLLFWECIPEVNEKGAPVGGMDQVKKTIANSVAGDIAELMNKETKVENELITGGDIAVLVRSHSQGGLIKKALGARGIASVQSSKDSIFETHEANEMWRLLTAIVEPQREDDVRRALVTELMGYRAQDLICFEQNGDAWEEILLSMQNWHYQWKQQGFLPMMRSLMKSESVHQRMLAYDDGDRRLTNILQLSELIHQATRQQSLGLEEVLRWLRQQQDSSNLQDSELRLESDENLVKIVTIHKSKGLEYPIVYCPFIGLSGKAFSNSIYTFYKDDKSCLEIGSADEAEHKEIKREEEKAEESRLLYVALTRAKYQCTVVAFPEKLSGSPDRTALGWLITDGSEILPGSTKAAKESTADFYSSYPEKLKKLVNDCDHIGVKELPLIPENVRYQAKESGQSFSARDFTVEIKSQAQITSFSGLTAGSHEEAPDHDAQIFQSTRSTQIAAPDENEFPRGATAGSTLHEIYENLDFTKPLDIQEKVVKNALSKWGFDEKHQGAATDLMEHSLSAEIFDGFSLSQLENKDRLNEMEFYLPLEKLQIDDLKQILFKHLPKDKNNSWQVVRSAMDTLYFEQVEGYLKGFIDLIFVHQGQYYLADYKSNSLADYAPENLLPVMADSHYYLQYLLYSVALHRYLQKRISDYSWETHVGGAYYLFIRGMSLQNEAGSLNSGVFFDKPSLELIEALDGLFMESLI